MAVIPSGDLARPTPVRGWCGGLALLMSLLLALGAVVCGPAAPARAAADALRPDASPDPDVSVATPTAPTEPAPVPDVSTTVPGDQTDVSDRPAAHDAVASDSPAPVDSPTGGPTGDGPLGRSAAQCTPAVEVAGGIADGPTASDDWAEVWTYGSVLLPVLDNDTAGRGCSLDPSSVGLLGRAAAGPRGSTDLILPSEGIWSVNSDGTLVFTPNYDFGGWSSWVRYSVQDSCGNAALARARVYMPAASSAVEPTEDAGSGGGAGDGGNGSDDQLAYTGAEPGGLLVVAFTLVLGGGLLLLLPERRRRKEDSAAA